MGRASGREEFGSRGNRWVRGQKQREQRRWRGNRRMKGRKQREQRR